ncbi:MAG: BMP family ABC transporter substrate-binding protein [Gaiella sp.]
MALRKWMVLGALALVGTLALTVVSVGAAKPAKSQETIRVAVVTDVGGLNDKGFNALAAKGLAQAKVQLGIQGRVFISKSAADYIPNLSTPARQGYDLVIANGFLMGDSLAAVAKRFPKTSFAIIDFPWVALKGKPKNARGLIFKEAEAGYLAGVAAATVAKGAPVSSVGGQAVPAVVAFLAGYKAGAKKTVARTNVLSGYSEDFVDQAKCKELALNQIQQGSKVVFAAAGLCGLGALQAAKEAGVWGIGVDNDQAFLGTHILTSATKKVDLAVFTTIRQVTEDAFVGGKDGVFTVKNGGVGFGTVSVKAPNRKALIAKLNVVSKQLADGKIVPPVK